MTLQDCFEELIAIDGVHPNEDEVLAYIKNKLDAYNVPFEQDDFGNIVATMSAKSSKAEPIAINGHVDIAAPLNGRKTIREGNILKTDGKSILGADDRSAVAAMLTLADERAAGSLELGRDVQLVFSRGEEKGLLGARDLDYDLFTAKNVMVLDGTGPVREVTIKAPSIVMLDVVYDGKNAHPAEWQKGINAGEFLLQAAAKLKQGEYKEGISFNIGHMNIGQVRNQVPGNASLLAELRSYDRDGAVAALDEIAQVFVDHGEKNGVEVSVKTDTEISSFELDKDSPLAQDVAAALHVIGIEPEFIETYGGTDGNVFSGRGKDVVVLGAGYYNPHGPEEYLNLDEFEEMYRFIRTFVSA